MYWLMWHKYVNVAVIQFGSFYFKLCNGNSDEGTLYHVPKAQDIYTILEWNKINF